MFKVQSHEMYSSHITSPNKGCLISHGEDRLIEAAILRSHDEY